MQRHLLGGFAIIAIILWLVLASQASGEDRATQEMVASMCMRIGFTLGALWLALPQVIDLSHRYPPWLVGCIGLGLLVFVIRPRLLLYVAPILAVIAFLQFVGWLFKPLPQGKKRPAAKGKSSQKG